MDFTIARRRAEIIARIREFFSEQGYLEVETPILAPAVIPESHLEVFRTEYIEPYRGTRTPLFLLPSPEIWMKKLIAAGSGDIFQISRCFRNAEDPSASHNPEFTMLEWYSIGADYMESLDRFESLAEYVIAHAVPDAPEAVRPPYRRLSMDEAFSLYAGFSLVEAMEFPALAERAREIGIEPGESDDWSALFDRVFLNRVEPRLSEGHGTIVYDYPATVATLAKRKSGTPWSERWEAYIGGFETINCYTEETDPRRVAEFFESEKNAKESAAVPVTVDTTFPKLFESGFPGCSGAALGLDRFVAALLGKQRIKGVALFVISDIIPYTIQHRR